MTTSSSQARTLPGCDHYSKSASPHVWWDAHYHEAASTVIDFFGGDGISLTGKRVADVGCGDGILDLGVAVAAKPDRLVGFDILTNDVDLLARGAAEHAGLDKLPDNLFFATSTDTRLPAEDASFDFVMSWSAFEHIADPVAVLREVQRILRPDGALFIQLWPFYNSAHGTHLVDWFPDGFAQFTHSNDEILRRVRSSGDQDMATEMLEVYRTLNGITADGLQDALRQAGFRIVKVTLDSEAVHIPEEAAHLPLSQVAISGIKLLAIPNEAADGEAADGEQANGKRANGKRADGQPVGSNQLAPEPVPAQPRHAEPSGQPEAGQFEAGSPS